MTRLRLYAILAFSFAWAVGVKLLLDVQCFWQRIRWGHVLDCGE